MKNCVKEIQNVLNAKIKFSLGLFKLSFNFFKIFQQQYKTIIFKKINKVNYEKKILLVNKEQKKTTILKLIRQQQVKILINLI